MNIIDAIEQERKPDFQIMPTAGLNAALDRIAEVANSNVKEFVERKEREGKLLARVEELEKQIDGYRGREIYLDAGWDAANKELAEEARLNAMGSEREARLMARVSELEKSLKELTDVFNPNQQGMYNFARPIWQRAVTLIEKDK